MEELDELLPPLESFKEEETSTKNHTFFFNGEGGSYFGVIFLNWVFTVLSLGLYYPWSKERRLKYVYGETELAGSRFSFHGTGREMFRGFVKAILIFGVLYGIYGAAILSKDPKIIIGGLLLFLVGFMLLVPIAIHGTMRYRLAKTEYRGIRFKYSGNLREFMKLYFIGIVYTIFTLGFYSSWLQVKIRQYVAENTWWGDLNFGFNGEGGDLLLIKFKGIFFLYPTLFIYAFYYMRNLHQFNINNLYIVQDGWNFKFDTSITAGDCFKIALYYLLGILSLGIFLPWAIMYEMKVMLERVEIDGHLDLDKSTQNASNTDDATGEDLGDMLDLDLSF